MNTAARRRVHILNPLLDPTGGSEWRAVSLYRELSPAGEATLWRFAKGSSEPFGVPSRAISTPRLSFPRGGTLVFVGVYAGIGAWLALSRPRRVVIVYNTPDPRRLETYVERVRAACRLEPEIVFCSQTLADGVNYSGAIEPSIIDTTRFAPVNRGERPHFTVGRLSRATAEKHHGDDLAFYRRLVDAGFRVDVLGATAEMIAAADRPGLRLRPAGDQPAEAHLAGLDCFFYRTAPDWDEPWGRVVIEAMASGLPVLIERRTGAASAIEHGRNGFLVEGEAEAFAILSKLRDDPGLRGAVGAAARETAVALMSAEARKAIRDFYLR